MFQFHLILSIGFFLVTASDIDTGDEDFEISPRFDRHFLDSTQDATNSSWIIPKTDELWFWYLQSPSEIATWKMCNETPLDLDLGQGEGFWVASYCNAAPPFLSGKYPSIKLGHSIGLYHYDMRIRCYVNNAAAIRISGRPLLTSENTPNLTLVEFSYQNLIKHTDVIEFWNCGHPDDFIVLDWIELTLYQEETNTPSTTDSDTEATTPSPFINDVFDNEDDFIEPWGGSNWNYWNEDVDFHYFRDVTNLTEEAIDFLNGQNLVDKLNGHNATGIWAAFLNPRGSSATINAFPHIDYSRDSVQNASLETAHIVYFLHNGTQPLQRDDCYADILVQVQYRMGSSRANRTFSLLNLCGSFNEDEVFKECEPDIFSNPPENYTLNIVKFYLMTPCEGDMVLLDKITITGTRTPTTPPLSRTTFPVTSTEETTSPIDIPTSSVKETLFSTQTTTAMTASSSSESTEASSPPPSSEMTEGSSPWSASDSTTPSTPPATTESKCVDATPVFLLSTLLPILINALP